MRQGCPPAVASASAAVRNAAATAADVGTRRKERPIIFSAPMVRALLAGTKTQTRRLAKAALDPDGSELRDADGWPMRDVDGGGEVRAGCPYGVPGDRLWVRETFDKRSWDSSRPDHAYRATCRSPQEINPDEECA